MIPRARDIATAASLYGRSSIRVLQQRRGRGAEERLVFVTGCPRSGTTFVAGAIGSQAGFVDLGEVHPLKAALPHLATLPDTDAALRLRRILDRVRRFGLAGGLRGVEQTPETAYVLPAVLLAYPEARIVHVVRDGRDVVCSLLARGWLSAGREGSDDAGLAYGAQTRFWVEREREEEFGALSDAGRAAYAWRRYVTTARETTDRLVELRYETVASDSAAAAEPVARHLHLDPEPLARAFGEAHRRSVGRWRSDLDEAQVADVEREVGPLLRELGYD
ncbi:MAG: sulfotransferase [Actinobacteria bacterium]|nr:sulfotransferase [Actinomycetota bacterium]